MIRNEILGRLADIERQAIDVARVLDRQQVIVAELAQGGHTTAEATELLRQLQELQAVHMADEKRLRAELAATLH